MSWVNKKIYTSNSINTIFHTYFYSVRFWDTTENKLLLESVTTVKKKTLYIKTFEGCVGTN